MAAYTEKVFITNKNLYSVLPKDKTQDLLFILGLLNSKLISYLYINQLTQASKDDFPQVTIKDVLSLPYPKINLENSKDIKLIVSKIADLKQQESNTTNPSDLEVIKRQVASAEMAIDDLVFRLYGLTQEEIKIVEVVD
jgi:hypothetical protein